MNDARWPKYFFVLLSVSALGPYMLKGVGVRLEHFIIYPAFGLATLLLVFNLFRYRIQKDLLVFTTFWLLLVGWVVWIAYGLGGPYMASLSTFENFLQPLALMVIVVVFSRYYRISDYFETMVKAFVIAMGVNSVIIVLQLVLDPMLFGALDIFLRGEGGTSTAERAATVGRYLGVHDQPLEAGANYSLAVLGWAYLERMRANVRGVGKYVLLTLIILGGIVTISKVFFLGGLFLFLVYILFHSRRETRRNFLYALPVLGGVVAYYLVTTVWQGLQFFLRYFQLGTSGNQTLLAKYTAGRFGVEDSPVREIFTKVYNESFVYGFALHDPPILDNGFAQIFYHGGLVGLLIYTALVLWLLYKSYEMYKYRSRAWVFLGFMVMLILGLNIGGPAFTLNRFAVNITLFISFMFLLQRDRAAASSPAGNGSSGPPPQSGSPHPHHR